MPDLDYVKLVGRLGITAADGPDEDDTPDTIWCDSGTIRITPLITYAKIAGATPSPWTAGNAVIDATLSGDGYLWHNGKAGVWLVDLTSPKVNPHYEDDQATYRIEFIDVMADGTPVKFPTVEVALTGPEVNDLTLVSPVPTGSPTPIIRGEQGTGIQSATVEGGELLLELTDGTEVNAGELPVGPGGSDAGVADYITTPGTDTAAALSATLVTGLADRPGPVVGSALTPVTAADPFPIYMDSMGRLLRGNDGNVLQRSSDNGDTWSTIYTFTRPPGGVRQLDNGELLVFTADDFPANTVKGALFLSSGYAAGGAVTFTKKLDATDYQQAIDLRWGFGGGNGVYAVSEYDSKAPGARSAVQRAWITQDSGATWTQIYNHGNGSLSSRHIHGIAADQYRPGTVWITLGDYTSDANGDRRIRVSRDYGATWADVTTDHQPTAIMVFPDCVAFGTDNAPNGVLRISNPAAPAADLVLDLAYRLNEATQPGTNTPILTHVAERWFRARTPEGHLTLLPYTASLAGYSGLVLGSYDGATWFEVWVDSRTYAVNPSRGVEFAVGPTKDGRILLRGRDDSGPGYFTTEVAAAAAPGVTGLATRLSKGVTRAMPRRALVAYANATGQSTVGDYTPFTILLAPLPAIREDIADLFTRASDGTGIIVNRDATVRIDACNCVPIGAYGGTTQVYLFIDGTLVVIDYGPRTTYTTRVKAGQKIRVQLQPFNFNGALNGDQVLTVEAWEMHS